MNSFSLTPSSPLEDFMEGVLLRLQGFGVTNLSTSEGVLLRHAINRTVYRWKEDCIREITGTMSGFGTYNILTEIVNEWLSDAYGWHVHDFSDERGCMVIQEAVDMFRAVRESFHLI